MKNAIPTVTRFRTGAEEAQLLVFLPVTLIRRVRQEAERSDQTLKATVRRLLRRALKQDES